MAKEPETTLVAFSSFSREEWEKLKQVAVDRDALHDSYEDWRSNVMNIRRTFLNKGVMSMEVEMTVEELQGWCRAKGCPLDSNARSVYAAERAKEFDKD